MNFIGEFHIIDDLVGLVGLIQGIHVRWRSLVVDKGVSMRRVFRKMRRYRRFQLRSVLPRRMRGSYSRVLRRRQDC